MHVDLIWITKGEVDTKNLNDLAKVTQLVRSGVRIQTHANGLQNLCV